MSKITLPPLPYTEALRKLDRDEWVYSTDQDFSNPEKYGWERIYTAEQMQERDRQVVEHVIRACAELLRKRARKQLTLARNLALEDGADALLALLPVNPATEAAMKRLADISDEMGLEK